MANIVHPVIIQRAPLDRQHRSIHIIIWSMARSSDSHRTATGDWHMAFVTGYREVDIDG